jgi:hypothetical protein
MEMIGCMGTVMLDEERPANSESGGGGHGVRGGGLRPIAIDFRDDRNGARGAADLSRNMGLL